MAQDSVFSPMNTKKLLKNLETLSPADLITVTLTETSILLGGVFKFWKDAWDEDRVVALSFNTDKGKRFGDSCIAHIPITSIAGVFAVPLDNASTPRISADDPQVQFLREMGIDLDLRLAVQDYPTPLASIIYEHNMRVATAVGLEISYYVEKSLSPDGIPSGGICFDNDFLMYADWAFFATQTGGGVNISGALPGFVNVEKSLSQSPEQQVLQRLKDSLGAKIQRHISSAIGTYKVLQGCLLVPEPAQDEIIEGEKCYLYKVAESRDDGAVYPILVKVEQLKFPIDFLNRINSELTFYGELLPIPVSIMGEKYSQVLLTRAIAYLKE